MQPKDSKWGSLEFSDQKELRLEWEGFSIRLIRRDSDLLLVEKRGDEATGELQEADPDKDFQRYAFEKPVTSIRVQPATPARPLVIQPLHPLKLAPKATVDFYVSIPVDVQLSTMIAKEAVPLECLRSEILSDTWFGDQVSGVLCYAIKSRARRECPSIDSEKTPRALCKIEIQNTSSEHLPCEKFCIRLERCHLWRAAGTIWTSPIKIRYRGTDHLSTIDYSDSAPEEAKNPIRITTAKEEPLSGVIRRTFAGLGGV